MSSARTKATVGLVWEAGTRGGLQVLSWISTILVARILFPEDYGLVAISGVFTGLLTLFSGFGINAAIVNRRIEKRGGLKGAFVVCAVSAILLYALLLAFSGLISEYYDRPELRKLIAFAGIIIVLSGLQLVPAALASVALAFKYKAVVNAIGQVLNVALTVTLALLGYGYWSLIAGVLLQEFIMLAMLWKRYPVNFREKVAYDEVARGLRYSLTMMSSKILGFVSSAVPTFVASVVFSMTTVGILALSITLAFAPVRKIGQVFNGITFATVSSTRDSAEGISHDVVWLLRYLCMVSFPALIGIYLVAEDVILILLSEKWIDAVPIVEIWCLVGIFELISQFSKAVIAGSGDAKSVMQVDFGYVVALPVALIIGTQYGLLGMAYGMMFLVPVVSLVLMARVMKATSLGIYDLISALMPAVVSTGIMYATAFFVFQPVSTKLAGEHSVVGLALVVIGCISVYSVVLLVGFRSALGDFRRQLRGEGKS